MAPGSGSGASTGQVTGGASALGCLARFGAVLRGWPWDSTTGLLRAEFCAAIRHGWPASPASPIISAAARLEREKFAVEEIIPCVWGSRSNDISMGWSQNYDPLHGPLSTLAAVLPLVLLLGLLALRRVPAYAAALAGLAGALAVAIWVIGMAASMAGRTGLVGAALGEVLT